MQDLCKNLKIIIKIHLRNIKLFIDGSHAVGQIPLDMKDLDPDYYISNGHKWLSSSHGSAFLYVKKSLQFEIHSPITSIYYGQGFQKEFQYTATRDYTSMFTFMPAIDFHLELKDENIWKYNNNLCKKAGNLYSIFD